MKLLTSTAAKIFYISIIFVVFVISFFVGIQVKAKELGVKIYDIGNTDTLPVLTGAKTFPLFSGQGIIAIDNNSNVTLFEKNPDMPLYPASTTKIITALVGLDYYSLDQVLTVQNANVEGQKIGLVQGEQMTFNNLLNALLIYSANDAATAIADNYPGGRDNFVDAMNAKAQSLHLSNSHFANPIGLDDPTQVTTARDMVRVAEIAMQNSNFAEVVGTKNKTITDVTGKFSYKFDNVNRLLGQDGVIGVKTGWTEEARENLVTDVQKDGHGIFIAILGSEDRFGETKEIIDWIYKNYSWQKVGFIQKAVGVVLK